MFTIGAIILTSLLMWSASRGNKKDRAEYDRAPFDDRSWILLLHLRQDLKLVVFLLAGIVVMLGVIADRTG